MAWLESCKHERVRCIHGDEIIMRGYARAACLDCDRALRLLPLPRQCYFTGEVHPTYARTPS